MRVTGTQSVLLLKKKNTHPQKSYNGKICTEHSRLGMGIPGDTEHLMDFQFCSENFLCSVSVVRNVRFSSTLSFGKPESLSII